MTQSMQQCACRCGQYTELAKRGSRWQEAGQPLKYVRGHRYRTEYMRRYLRKWHGLNPDKVKEIQKRDRDKLKLDVLTAYSSSPPACACCAEAHLEFLILDHIDGGGNQARRQEGHKGGTQQYRRLRQLGFPAGYRVLCWNCNAAIGLHGRCPHEAEDKPLRMPKKTLFAVVR